MRIEVAVIPPQPPSDEPARLRLLHSLGILDTDPEASFDRITRIARRLFDVPIALVSLVDAERQWFKSRLGLVATQTGRDISFCGHALAMPEPLVIGDALADERFADNPLVSGPPHIRAYAGVPLVLEGCDSAMGTLCVIDTVARSFDAQDLNTLQDLAAMVVGQLQLRADAVTDPLTRVLNRRGFAAAASPILAQCLRTERAAILLHIDLDDFKSINDVHGHPTGDAVLAHMARHLRRAFRASDVVGRMGGDEFAVLCPETSARQAEGIVDRLRRTLAPAVSATGHPIELRFTCGVARYDPRRHDGWESLMGDADRAMYARKCEPLDLERSHATPPGGS